MRRLIINTFERADAGAEVVNKYGTNPTVGQPGAGEGFPAVAPV